MHVYNFRFWSETTKRPTICQKSQIQDTFSKFPSPL